MTSTKNQHRNSAARLKGKSCWNNNSKVMIRRIIFEKSPTAFLEKWFKITAYISIITSSYSRLRSRKIQVKMARLQKTNGIRYSKFSMNIWSNKTKKNFQISCQMKTQQILTMKSNSNSSHNLISFMLQRKLSKSATKLTQKLNWSLLRSEQF